MLSRIDVHSIVITRICSNAEFSQTRFPLELGHRALCNMLERHLLRCAHVDGQHVCHKHVDEKLGYPVARVGLAYERETGAATIVQRYLHKTMSVVLLIHIANNLANEKLCWYNKQTSCVNLHIYEFVIITNSNGFITLTLILLTVVIQNGNQS